MNGFIAVHSAYLFIVVVVPWWLLLIKKRVWLLIQSLTSKTWWVWIVLILILCYYLNYYSVIMKKGKFLWWKYMLSLQPQWIIEEWVYLYFNFQIASYTDRICHENRYVHKLKSRRRRLLYMFMHNIELRTDLTCTYTLVYVWKR